MMLYIVFQVFYVTWRVTQTIVIGNVGDTVFSTLLVLTEVLSFSQTFIFMVLFWKGDNSSSDLQDTSEFTPNVDIFIATYNEPVDLLEETIASTLLVDYPQEKRTVICVMMVSE